MASGPVEKHELAGVDDRERGFNRLVELHPDPDGYRAVLQYEKTRVQGEPSDNAAAAVTLLVTALHRRGYSQVRSRLSFRGEDYLGSQELWVEYPDPEPTNLLLAALRTSLGRLRKLLKP
jgi:hypothetical protein